MASVGFVYGLLLGNCGYQTDRKIYDRSEIALRLRSSRDLRTTKLQTRFPRGRENYQSNADERRLRLGSHDCTYVADNETDLFLHRTLCLHLLVVLFSMRSSYGWNSSDFADTGDCF